MVSELLSVLMTEKLEGKGTNAERLAVLEGAVNQVLDASEAHRLEVATQMQVLTKAVSELTEAIKGPKKKHKNSYHSSSSDSGGVTMKMTRGLTTRMTALRPRKRRKSGIHCLIARNCRFLFLMALMFTAGFTRLNDTLKFINWERKIICGQWQSASRVHRCRGFAGMMPRNHSVLGESLNESFLKDFKGCVRAVFRNSSWPSNKRGRYGNTWIDLKGLQGNYTTFQNRFRRAHLLKV